MNHENLAIFAAISSILLSPSYASAQAEMVPDDESASSSKPKDKCYPATDSTGVPYPVCPSVIKRTAILSTVDERVAIDATTDTYARLKDKQHDNDEIEEPEWEEAKERIRLGRAHASGEFEEPAAPREPEISDAGPDE